MEIYADIDYTGGRPQRYIAVRDLGHNIPVLFEDDEIARLTRAFADTGYAVALEAELQLHLSHGHLPTKVRIYGIDWDDTAWKIVHEAFSSVFGALSGTYHVDQYDEEVIAFNADGSTWTQRSGGMIYNGADDDFGNPVV